MIQFNCLECLGWQFIGSCWQTAFVATELDQVGNDWLNIGSYIKLEYRRLNLGELLTVRF